MALWSHLEDDVLAGIIALLPSDDLPQVALVCKTWKRVSDLLVQSLRPRTVAQVAWARRFPELVRLDLSAASYESCSVLFQWGSDSSDDDLDDQEGATDEHVPPKVFELVWGTSQATDLLARSSKPVAAAILDQRNRHVRGINVFATLLPRCTSLTSLELTGQAETDAMCTHAMCGPTQWAHFLGRLNHLRISSSLNCTAAVAVCICFSSGLTSLHISGCPPIPTLDNLRDTIPYSSPSDPSSFPADAAPAPTPAKGQAGIIPVPFAALEVAASVAISWKQPLPCSPATQGNSPGSSNSTESPVADPYSTSPPAADPSTSLNSVLVRDHASLLPKLRSLTTDGRYIVFFGSIDVLSQHPPGDLLTQLPNLVPHQPDGQLRTPACMCLSSIAAAIMACALALPSTPPSAPAWLAAYPDLTHLDAPHAALLFGATALSALTRLALRHVPPCAVRTLTDGHVPTPALCSLTFPLPLAVRTVASRPVPQPGQNSLLTFLNLSPPKPTTVPFATLLRLLIDCPALVELDVSNCLTSPPASVLAPRTNAPVHYFIHPQSSIDSEGDLLIPSMNGPSFATRGRPAALQRFACDNAPGSLYLLPLLDSIRPVRRLGDVSLNGNLCLPGRLLALLAQQSGLIKLQLLRSARAISPPQDTAVLALLAALTSLTSLHLSPSAPSCEQACTIALTAVLPEMRKLRILALPFTAVGRPVERLLSALSQLQDLQSLDISHADLQSPAVAVVVKSCPWIKHLSIAHSSHVTNSDVPFLTRLSQLESLSIAGCAEVDDKSAGMITRMTSLTRLDIACTNCSAFTARALAELPRLRHVSLCPHWEMRSGRGKGGAVLVNHTCQTPQREDMVAELATCPVLRAVEASTCLFSKARNRLVYDGVVPPLWMTSSTGMQERPC